MAALRRRLCEIFRQHQLLVLLPSREKVAAPAVG